MRRFCVVLALAAAGSGITTKGEQLCAQDNTDLPITQKVGLLLNDQRAFQGYTLLAPLTSNDTYLIDLEGRVVRTWHSDCQPALSAYLLENGNLLRCGAMLPREQPFGGPGAAAKIQEFSWDGELVWELKFDVDRLLPHHDVTPLPNGNVLVVAWDKKTFDEAVSAGRRPESIDHGRLLSDCILEIKPTSRTTGEIVWKWHAWDHLIQDHDPTKANYGSIAEHPERIDVNLTEEMFGNIRLRPLGDVSAPVRSLTEARIDHADVSADWTHVNSVAYNPQLDQIVLSVRAFSEIWIIDHGTTTAEAASHQGGRCGKGGDLLYRWGNPATYRGGTKANQRLFKQHNAHWIPTGLPGAGHILLFNNGNNRPGGHYSTADEIVLPVNRDGQYKHLRSLPLEPDNAGWTYAAPVKADLFSMVISGAQRLPNGNTLICSGASGTLIEVTPQHEQVWKYVNPVKGSFLGFERLRKRPPEIGRGGLHPVNNGLFRANRYGPDYAGLRGKHLEPGQLLEELHSANPDKSAQAAP